MKDMIAFSIWCWIFLLCSAIYAAPNKGAFQQNKINLQAIQRNHPNFVIQTKPSFTNRWRGGHEMPLSELLLHRLMWFTSILPSFQSIDLIPLFIWKQASHQLNIPGNIYNLLLGCEYTVILAGQHSTQMKSFCKTFAMHRFDPCF